MTANHDPYMTPQALLERIYKDRKALATLWGGLTQEQMIRRPGPQEDWSVVDVAFAQWVTYTGVRRKWLT